MADLRPPLWLAVLLLAVALFLGVRITRNVTATLTGIAGPAAGVPHVPPPD